MDKFETALTLLPPDIRECLREEKYRKAEEIRLRCGKRASALINGKEEAVLERKITLQELSLLVEKASGASIQAHLHEIKEAYINYRGLRIGICGTAAYSDKSLLSIHNINSVNIRIPHSFCGDISHIRERIRKDGYQSTLIISPPGYGKTSLLRELIRFLSAEGKRVCVVDERNELACNDAGLCYFQLGEHCDVMTGVKKSEGAMMLLRTMSPDIIAFDEVSKKEDIAAIYEIAGCGVEIFATAHGRNIDSLRQRPLYRAMLAENIFKSIISIKLEGSARKYIYTKI